MDWSTIDVSTVMTAFLVVVPVTAGAVLSFVGFRKSWNFLKGQIKGA